MKSELTQLARTALHSRGVVAVLIVTGLFTAGAIMGQLQQSGGGGSSVTTQPGSTTAVTQPTGTNLHAVIDTGSTTAVTQATGANLHTVVDSGTITAVTGITNALPAGTNVIGHVITDSGTINTVPKTACGNTVASVQLGAVPTSATLATSAATSCVVAIVLNNTNGSAATVTVTDNTATPINDLLTFSIPANSQLIQPLYGIAFNLGVKWSASTTGVTGGMIAYQ